MLALMVTVVVAAAGYGVYLIGLNRGMHMTNGAPNGAAASSTAPQKAGDVDPTNGKKILYWHDPMVPGQKFDKPGKSPFMDMNLVPVYADDAPGGAGVAINPRLQQNLGVRTAKAVAGSFSSSLITKPRNQL